MELCFIAVQLREMYSKALEEAEAAGVIIVSHIACRTAVGTWASGSSCQSVQHLLLAVSDATPFGVCSRCQGPRSPRQWNLHFTAALRRCRFFGFQPAEPKSFSWWATHPSESSKGAFLTGHAAVSNMCARYNS